MKTKLLILVAITFGFFRVTGQTTIPNGGFENWTSGTYENPRNYMQSSNSEAFFRYNVPSNCIKSAEAYHGSYAVQLITREGGAMGYVVNTKPAGNPPWHGGFPYNQKPTGIRGYYKSAVPAGDSAVVLVDFSLNGNNVGNYAYTLYGTHDTYTLFSFTFDPPPSSTPDSVIIGITSSDVFHNIALAGSMVQVDSVSFTGVTSQPALLNGDFELWDPYAVKKVMDWYTQSGSDGQSVLQTEDKAAGNYAVEMVTVAGDNNGNPKAQSSGISTGYYDESCQCEKGGEPFTKEIDTLTFYYKYAPSGLDTADVNVDFKKDGSQIGENDMKLNASNTWQHIEIPVSLGLAPDSAIVSFNSSLWSDSLLTYAGSDLKVDEVYFKSDLVLPTGVVDQLNRDRITVYPNPGQGQFFIQSDHKFTSIDVMSAAGKKIYSGNVNADRVNLDLTSQPEGIYFYQIQNNGKVVATGKIILDRSSK